MKIAFVGKFGRLHDEEYIARSLEMLGHDVKRLDERSMQQDLLAALDEYSPDVVLWTKLSVAQPFEFREHCRKWTTICWVFDLYFGYVREARLQHPAFTADYVFTTDGGHDEEFKALGINHRCVRQGIYRPECFLSEGTPENNVAFVGSENTYNTDRHRQIDFLVRTFPDFLWYGKSNTHEVRGTDLNELYARTKILVGDSVYSPFYWSNRVVETLGRGGFLIHQDVPGLREEYPFLATYPRRDLAALKERIDYFLEHEDERLDTVEANWKWVRDNYTMDKQCAKLLGYL